MRLSLDRARPVRRCGRCRRHGAAALLGRGPATAVVRASWALTPGVLNPAVTQATIRATICTRGWTRTVRPPVSYTNALKVRQLVQYGLRGPPSAFQEDHLISLELGRQPDRPAQPVARALSARGGGRPDRERAQCPRLRRSLTLAEAQRRESSLKHASG